MVRKRECIGTYNDECDDNGNNDDASNASSNNTHKCTSADGFGGTRLGRL